MARAEQRLVHTGDAGNSGAGVVSGHAVERDDDLFYSAITAVGRLGVVYAVVLEVELDYWLLERRRPLGESWPAIAAELRTSMAAGHSSPTGIFTTRGDVNFLQLALNPNDSTLCFTMQRKRVTPGGAVGLGGGGSALGSFCHPQSFADLAVEADIVLRPLVNAIATGGAAAVGLVIPDPLLVSLAQAGAATWVNIQLDRIRNLILTSANLGELAAGVLSDYPFLVPTLTSLILRFFTALDFNGPANQFKRGRAFQVMDQTDYAGPTDCYFGVGSEYLFNARAPGFLTFVDSLFTSAAALGGIPGYVSLRFIPQTDAYIGMERWPLSVAVEIGCLTPWAAAIPYLTAAQTSAAANGGIPHWGQWLNEPLTTGSNYGLSLRVFNYAVAAVESGHSTSFRTPFSTREMLDAPGGGGAAPRQQLPGPRCRLEPSSRRRRCRGSAVAASNQPPQGRGPLQGRPPDERHSGEAAGRQGGVVPSGRPPPRLGPPAALNPPCGPPGHFDRVWSAAAAGRGC